MTRFRLHTLVLLALVATGLSRAAAAQTPIPPQKSPAVTVPGITVMGDRPKSAYERLLRLPMHSAASCAFSPGSDDYAAGYILSMRSGRGYVGAPGIVGGSDLRSAGLEPWAVDSYDGYFSATSPLGDTASGMRRPSVFNPDGPRGECRDSDYRFAAGRAFIAMRDKTLPSGLALYAAGRYAEALPQFKKAYHKLPDGHGGQVAALMIGKIYMEAPAPTGDPAAAMMWLRRAAMAPQNRQVWVPFDPANPYAYITTAGEAAVILGRAYLYGYGAPKDLKTARRWFDRAYDVGFVPAAKTLGDLEYAGYDGTPDPKRAAVFYKRAAEYGFAPAQYALAEVLQAGEVEVGPAFKTPLDWYAVAARQRHPGALYALAVAYDRGEGVSADPAKALGYYKEAALAGDAAAQCALGSYFYEGKQLPKDDVAARRWFEAAARGGDADGMFNLAVMLMKGEGGGPDRVKAWAWFKLADQLKRQNAGAAVRLIEARMTADEKRAAAELLGGPRAG